MTRILKQGETATIRFMESLIKTSDGSRLTTGATVRVCIDGTWGDGAGTLSVDETDQWKYTLHSSEAAGRNIEIAIDHADAVGPIGGAFTLLDARSYAITVEGVASDIADAVWDEDLTEHTTEDTAGDILGNVADALDAHVGELLWKTTINTASTQTVYVLNGGPEKTFTGNSRSCTVVIRDADAGDDGGEAISVRRMVNYFFDDPVRTLTVDSAPEFTVGAGTVIEVYRPPMFEEDRTAIADILDDTGTSGVKIANDAITSEAFDEVTAFALASADSGSTAVARTGADSDTLETLSDQIDGVSGASASEIADAVWDEDLTEHTTEDTAGDILGNVATGTPPSAEAVADAVWDEATSGHTTAGTFGEQLKTDVDAALARITTALPNAAPAGSGGLPTVDSDNYIKGLQSAAGVHVFDDLTDIEDARVKLDADQPDYAPAKAGDLPTNFSALGINSSGHVERVTLVDTTTANSDMRGTDDALPTASYTAPDNASVAAIKTKTDQLAFEDGKVNANAEAVVGQESIDDIIEGVVEGVASPNLLLSTTIATLTNQTTFTLTAGPPDDDALADAIAIIIDESDATQKTFAPIKKYTAASKTVILARGPKFAIAAGDTFQAVIDSKPLLTPEFVDRNHTWRFDNSRQTTAPNRVTENTSFDGLVKIDFTNCIDSDDSLASINIVTIAPTTGDAPTLGTPYLHTNGTSVVVPLACTEDGDPCDTGTYTITVSVTTADSQVISRKCMLIVEES